MACAAAALMQENIWVDRFRVEDAELAYHQALATQRAGLVVENATNHCGGGENVGSDLINEIARARQNIKNTLNDDGVGLKVGVGVENPELQARLTAVEQENKELKKVTAALEASVSQLVARVTALEAAAGSVSSSQQVAPTESKGKQEDANEDEDDDDDDFDLFGAGDDDEEEAAKLREQRQKEMEEKKKKKPAVIAKSSIVLDVKPWDDETDMQEMEDKVRTLKTDGLVWGAAKLVAVGYGIKKLQIMCVVEDDKVGTDYLEEEICAFEDLVQSVDIVAFNKI